MELGTYLPFFDCLCRTVVAPRERIGYTKLHALGCVSGRLGIQMSNTQKKVI